MASCASRVLLTFEAPDDDNTDNTYTVTVQASDGGTDTTAMEAVTVRVTNVDEAGTIVLSTLQPQVGVVITATLSDGDEIGAENLASIEWQVVQGQYPYRRRNPRWRLGHQHLHSCCRRHWQHAEC